MNKIERIVLFTPYTITVSITTLVIGGMKFKVTQYNNNQFRLYYRHIQMHIHNSA